jgi:hypothetical protein
MRIERRYEPDYTSMARALGALLGSELEPARTDREVASEQPYIRGEMHDDRRPRRSEGMDGEAA